MGYVGILYLLRLIDFFRSAPLRHGEPLTMTQAFTLIGLIIDMILIIMVELGVCGLACYQCELISANTTSLEGTQKKRLEAKLKRRKWRWPYDLGCRSNWRRFMGNTWSSWLLPTPRKGSGLEFKKRESYVPPQINDV